MTHRPALRGLCLFANFFLIILAYYLIKPASRSLYLEHFTAAQLPYVWIVSAVVLGALMPLYSRLVGLLDRRVLVLASCGVFSGLLVYFGLGLRSASSAWEVAAFYIFVDILSVVLVEQFWSLTNSAFASDTGSRWFGFVGSGGLAGGLVGGWLATRLITDTALQTPDLLLVAAAIIASIAAFTGLLARLSLYAEQDTAVRPAHLAKPLRLRGLLGNRYLMLITATILLAQLIEPIIEYQFMSHVAASYPEREARTAFLSTFLSVLGGLALAINLLLTPLILRSLGAIAGMLVQPLVVAISASAFYANAGLVSGAVMKIGDRGLSYSLNRAAKEMLYVPVEPALIYRAKAWIDMFGYRLFKIFGSLLILAFTQWLALPWDPATFSLLVVPICGLWLLAVIWLRDDYSALRLQEKQAQSV